MTDPFPKACVILGAGASHDVRNDGSPEEHREWKPPLARDLFDLRKNKVYWDILERYPGAKVLAQEIASFVSEGEFSIEQKLREFADHDSQQIQEHFRFVPPYLRDLVHFACGEYTPTPSNYIRLVMHLLEFSPNDVLFLVLNYDTLLETAITEVRPSYQFLDLQHYIEDSRRAKVVKLHGSTNWFLPFGDRSVSWQENVRDVDVSALRSIKEIFIGNSVSEARNFSNSDDKWLYPNLTA